MKINKATLGYLKCTLFQWVFSVCSQQFTLSVTSTTRFFNERSLLSYAKKKNKILANFVEMLLRLFCAIEIYGFKRTFWVNRVKSCYFTLPLQTVDTPFPQQFDIPQGPIVHRLLLQPVVCSCHKERCEKQARGIARGKRKRRRTQMWTGERSPFSLSPWRIFSLTLAFPVLLVPTTVEPLHWDTSIQGTQKFGAGKMFT